MNPSHTATYRDGASPIQDRVADLVSHMTLEEKVSQMVFDAPAIERLGIPAYNWWNECLHGVGRAGMATVFPQAIGLAATWNPELLHRIASTISDEARAKHHEALRRDIRQIYSGLTHWSPNVNIFRDPRWGRGQETYGEDPYLTATMGVAFVKGLQGDDPHYLKLVATPKHFAVHSGPESGRHKFDAHADERDLRETYLPAFEACVREGKAASVMGAYNRLNGEPCCASPTLLEGILRQEWGFDGYVVSDCGAIRDIFEHHQVVNTAEEAAALAVKAGCDLNCGSVYPALLEAVAQGLVSEETIDRTVERLFTARFRLGMFDPPGQVPYAQIPYEIVDSPDHRALALEAARQSMVLLKNEGNLLPLPKDLGSIAVIGPNADDPEVLLGNYNGTPMEAVTPLEGIRRKISPGTQLRYAQGCALADGVPPLQVIPSTYLRPADGDAAGTTAAAETGLTAAYHDGPGFEGPAVLKRVDRAVDFTWKDTTPATGRWGDPFAVRWTGFLVPPASARYRLGVKGFSEYRLSLDGEPVAEYQGTHHPVLKSQERELEGGRHYRLQLDYVNRGLDPQVQLLWAPPGIDDEAAALEVAEKADVIVTVLGLSPRVEGEEMPLAVDGFAGGDRTRIELPRPQEALLRKLHGLGKPVVLVLLNGSALAIPWAAEQIPAIVEAWYPGQAGGDALADVLFGDSTPGGRLPVTFYRSTEDLPPFEDYQMTGRTYRYYQGEPLFPFGHGLSYTSFEFDHLQITPSSIPGGSEHPSGGGQVAISADVTNNGERAGDEVIQVYLRHRDTAVPQPIKELKAFQRITLQPGERRTVTFLLQPHQLGYYDEAMQYEVWPGVIEVMVGNSSQNLPLIGSLEITSRASGTGEEQAFFSQVRIE